MCYICRKKEKLYFEISDIEGLSGDEAHIYSVRIEGHEYTLLEEFFEENQVYQKELNSILEKLNTMGNDTGCRRGFFKHEEGKPGDGVAALREGQLRLYCLYFDRTAVIFGSGGYKPPRTKAYQETESLNEKAQQMIKIADCINEAIVNKDIKINDDGSIDFLNEIDLNYD